MRNLGRSVLGLWVLVMGLVLSASAQADSVGPYYAMPSWDQTLPAATRFIVLSNFASAAVLDRETGLVWEKVPSSSIFSWFEASNHCLFSNTGGRMGWRLPTFPELLSLVDLSKSSPPLPSGHPFTVQSTPGSAYWSATTDANFTASARGVLFEVFGAGSGTKSRVILSAWCVRGGSGVDAQ